MTVSPVSSATAQLHQLNLNQNLSIIDEVDELIKDYESKPIDREHIVASARHLIEKFNHLSQENLEQSLSFAREGLCRLLKLGIEEIQLESINSLKFLFRANDLLSYDVKTNQFQHFLGLEKYISEVIESLIRLSVSGKLLTPLLNLYIDVLERLWLLPHLIYDQSSCTKIIEESHPRITHQANQWIELFLENEKKDEEIESTFRKIQYFLKHITACSPYMINQIISLKSKLNSVDLLALIGEIYRKTGNNEQAFKKYKEHLDFDLSFKTNNLTQKQQLENVEDFTWKRLGTFYTKWKNSPKDIEYYERHLQSAQEIQDQKRIMQCYGCIGATYLALNNCQKALEYQEKKLKLAQEIKDLSMSAVAYREIGNVSFVLKDFHKAIEYYEKYLKNAQEINDEEEIYYAYDNLGNTYRSLLEFHKSKDCFEKALSYQKTEEQDLIKKTYFSLGDSYHVLGEHQKSIGFIEIALKISQDFEDQKMIGKCYRLLGSIYTFFRDYSKSIEYYEKSLKIAQVCNNQDEVLTIYSALGTTYSYLGEYLKAIEYQEKAIHISQDLGDEKIIGFIHADLALIYQAVGENLKALDYLEKALKIFQIDKKPIIVGKLSLNIGGIYHSIGEHSKALQYFEEALRIGKECDDKEVIDGATGNIGVIYTILNNPLKSIKYHEERLKIAQDMNDKRSILVACNNLGFSYSSLQEHTKAIEYYEKSLEIAQEIGDRAEMGRSYVNIGNNYWTENVSKAKEYYKKGIDIYASIQSELADNSQLKISIFENQALAYSGLEKLLISQKEEIPLLEITEARRARGLISSVAKKSSNPVASLSSINHTQIQELACELQTTFIIYSLICNEFLMENEKRYAMNAGVITPKGEVDYYMLPLGKNHSGSNHFSMQLQVLIKEVENLSTVKRGVSENSDDDFESFMESDEVKAKADTALTQKSQEDQQALKQLKETYLRSWYELLIAPLEKSLPVAGSSITIIPDGVLSQFPFGAFCDKDGTYLIEKYAISFAPSIKTLQLLHQLPKEYPSTSLVVGSPDTGRPIDYLQVADDEAKTVSSLINGSQLLSKKEATISTVSQKMQEARFIHLACHGLAEKKYDKHSVFEGLFKLAPDENDPEPKPEHGHLYAQQIAALNLKAELVFLSACYSGKGNVKQEGSIGPVWSFLGAGARSTVATYWPLPDSATTFEMVESFYKAIQTTDRSSLNKAQVLRQVTLKAMEKNRDDFIQWGAFFLSGVSINAKLE